MPKVSVIIPIYNTKQYLKQCVNSLLTQTLDDVEFIFIDDHSTDGSLSLLYELTNNSQRNCKVLVNSHNLGSAMTRKRGYLEATGDFFIVCDSDDWADANELEELYNTAICNKADIVYCNFYENKDGKDILVMQDYGTDRIMCISKMLTAQMHASTCTKLTRRNLLFKSNFFDLNIQDAKEDLTTSIYTFVHSSKIFYLNKSYYHYRYNGNSMTRNASFKSFSKVITDCVYNALIIEQMLKDNGLFKTLENEMLIQKYSIKNKIYDLMIYSQNKFYEIFPEANDTTYALPYIRPRTKLRQWFILKTHNKLHLPSFKDTLKSKS